MDIQQMYREIVNEHNLHPDHKKAVSAPTMTLKGVNPSCGDSISIELRIKDGVIEDAGFTGSGCAISQASADMMCERIIGESEEEARKLAADFMGMIRGTATEEEIESLDEASALQNIAHMPARVKCATLSWRTMSDMIDQLNAEGAADGTHTAAGADACGACEIK